MAIRELYDLKGKNALVTGSSQGIGKAIALGLAEMGANILVHYRGEKKMAEDAVNEIRKSGVKAETVKADLSKPESAEYIAAESSRLIGQVDILVLNASVQIRRNWQVISLQDFVMQINVNMLSGLLLLQKFVPHMQEQKWGKILTIGSVQQNRPHPDMLIYSATKAAICNMVKSLAIQLAPFGININNLAPGTIDTIRNRDVLNDPVYLEKVRSKIPLGYIGQPLDCVNLAVLLCSDAGKYITGENIFVDGGMNIPF